MASSLRCDAKETLLKNIEESQVGFSKTISGPFGPRRGNEVGALIGCTVFSHWILHPQLYTRTTPLRAGTINTWVCHVIRSTGWFHTFFCRALGFIEDYIRDEVLPLYANTHTGTSITSRQSTQFREEARYTYCTLCFI